MLDYNVLGGKQTFAFFGQWGPSHDGTRLISPLRYQNVLESLMDRKTEPWLGGY
jgi:hypothetical protein